MNRFKKVFNILLKIMVGVVAAFVFLIAILSITEYKPSDEEDEKIDLPAHSLAELTFDDSFTILSWNVGFAGQGKETDSFLDGGKDVIPTSTDGVQKNLEGIEKTIIENDPDFIFMQEVDTDSKRSNYINEYDVFEQSLTNYSSSFSINYSTLYVPYPFPVTYGKVNAGIAVFSKYSISNSTRVSLPNLVSWPKSTVYLKRCLQVTRVPIAGSEKELVLINLHLEAYDNGEGKAAQTKQLAELLKSEYSKGNYVIAAGDFNQTFSTCDASAYPTLNDNWQAPIIDMSQFGDKFFYYMDNSVPSCRSLYKIYEGANHDPKSFQYYMIDGFIVSNNISVENMATLDYDFEYSDHNPIMIKASLIK